MKPCIGLDLSISCSCLFSKSATRGRLTPFIALKKAICKNGGYAPTACANVAAFINHSINLYRNV